MPVLVLNVGSPNAITVVCQKAVRLPRTWLGTKSDSFNGAERNSIRGYKENYGVTTTHLVASDENEIRALANGQAVRCQGDIIGLSSPLCSIEVTRSEMVAGESNGRFEMDLTLHEIVPTIVMFRYLPGDTFPGEIFARSTPAGTASYTDVNGVVQYAAVNIMRKLHYINGVPHFLLEAASSNFCLQSESIATAPWAVVGTPTITSGAHTASGISLDLIGDDDAAVLEGYQQTIAFTTTAVKAFSVHVKQDTSTSSVLLLTDTTAVLNRLLGTLTWVGGLPVVTMTTGTYLGYEALTGGVFRLLFSATSVTSGNTNVFFAYPATTAALVGTSTGTLYVGGVMWENVQTAPTSYIKTAAALVTRSADNLRVPWLRGPEERTMYVNVIDLSPVSAGRLLAIGIAPSRDLLYHSSATLLAAFHANLANVSASSTVAIAAPTRVPQELAHRLYQDGSVDIVQSVNGAAPTYGPKVALTPLEETYSTQELKIGGDLGASVANTAFREITIMTGVRSIDEMRAA